LKSSPPSLPYPSLVNAAGSPMLTNTSSGKEAQGKVLL
jgi:hypothetical protein